ncbi:uncharacterized protein [Phyllobates terribilis]|uniref:uncharacterized protein n=1 Tax=Phyllobates terribilis TaxID=111132 RepID=UPI003CCACD08
MWTVASRGSAATLGVDSGSAASVNSFLKDGRKITVGDCALFKPPNDSPPFIGFIRSLSLDKDNNLKLRVNWLYRPAEVVLGKGVVLEAAPNEVFYSFHRDETLAASLLHPCKVAFLPKGAELPSGVSSFICRRVYDITNKCLWWLTDKDYINDRQEEVDQLLQKSCSEMHPTVQHGTNSPKSVNGVVTLSPLKHIPDSIQNNGTYASHPKGKKRDLGDQAHEPMKRDIVLSRSGSNVKSELSKITDKGGLVDSESVEKLVQLMQTDKLQKKADFSCRSMFAGIIACTDKFDCLTQFVQLRGLVVLDDWLQEIHKGKLGDSGSDKSVEDFLLVLLRALDKLPVNLNALQTCNIGKSVNNLRSHKNLEIQKKSRGLVDTWKKRVEQEMNMNDTKPKSNQLASTKSGPLKYVQGDTITRSSSVPTGMQKTAVSVSLTATNHKEEKSSGSSQSHTNSQSSSDHPRNIVRAVKEDSKCSTAGSKNIKNIRSSKDRKSDNNGTAPVAESNGHSNKIIVKIPNRGQAANTASVDDSSCKNMTSQTNDSVVNVPEVCNGVSQSTENELNDERLVDSSMSSMNALIDSCAKFSEAHTPVFVSVGDDDSGMNLLASVATGEITRSGGSSPEIAANSGVDNEDPSKPSISNEDPQHGDPFSKNNGKLDSAGKSGDAGPEQIQEKVAVKKEESHDSVSYKKLIANNHSVPQDQIMDGIQCKEEVNNKDSMLQLSSNCADKSNPDQSQTNNTCSANTDEGLVDSTCVHEVRDQDSAKQVTETTHEFQTCNSNKRIKLEKTIPICSDREEVSLLASVGSSKNIASTDIQVDKKECLSPTANSSSSSANASETDRKLEFDLNEGFDMDDPKNEELSTVLFPSPASALPSFITVASAAKRPFVPPEDLLRNRSELGWKGSAATSAFRPAEPRKPSVKDSKPVRAFLDIDLNVTDEMVMEDNTDSKSGVFELDLNRADDTPETGHQPSSNNIANGHSSSSTERNFDLNDGPAADESTVYNQHPQGMFGMRMNNSLSSWYSPATTTASPFNTDYYRGSVVSSSPAMPFVSTPFQYPAVFPFGTSFPLPASGDLSIGGRFLTPGAVSSQYLRPCVVSLPDVSRQGLDLNSGPLGVDADEGLINGLRQLPVANPQALMMDIQASNRKRNEPEGGWDRYQTDTPKPQKITRIKIPKMTILSCEMLNLESLSY